MSRLPPILARDYRRVRVWPFIATMTLFAMAGFAVAFIILVTIGYLK